MGALLSFRRPSLSGDTGVGVLSSVETSPRAATVRYSLTTTRPEDCCGRIDAIDGVESFRAIARHPRLALFTGDGRRLELERTSGNGTSWIAVRRVGTTGL